MAEFPALPLWTDAYLADTRHLTTHEHGAYLLLLMEAWRHPDCSLPDNDRVLARLTCMNPGRWARCKDTVLAFFELGDDGRWRQKRLTKERLRVDEWRLTQSKKGKASAKARALKNNGSDSTSVPTQRQPGGNNHIHIQTQNPKRDSEGARKTLPPDDFAPTESTLKHGRERGLSDEHIHEAAIAYRNWCIANDKRRTARGHQAGLQNWLKTDAQDAQPSARRPANGHGRRTQREIKHDFAHAAREIVDEERGGGEVGGEAPAFDA